MDVAPLSLTAVDSYSDELFYNHQNSLPCKELLFFDGNIMNIVFKRILIRNRFDYICKQIIWSTASHFDLFVYLANKTRRSEVCNDCYRGQNFS